MEFAADYFDGRTSARHPVRVRRDMGMLHVSGPGVDFAVQLGDVRAQPPVAGTRHLLRLPAGAELDTDDAAAVRSIFPQDLRRDEWLRRLEGRWTPALAALLAIGVFTGWMGFFGLPMAAQWAAAKVPDPIARELGEQTLAAFDRTFCGPSLVAEGRQRILRDGIAAVLVGELPGHYGLAFRSCPAIGANAFALADGTIVVTDDLVRLAANDEELGAILAHEIGHVVYGHPLRLALQSAGVAILVSTLAGDAVSVSSLAVALPTVLMQSGYSRALEDEADAFAIQRLVEVRISPAHLANMLERLEAEHRGAGAKTEATDYLSTHPATAMRIERARAFAR